MTTIAIHQPAFLPYPGYIDRIKQVDSFFILSFVQFEKGSFTNRNRIKTRHGTHWITLPVGIKGHMAGTIAETKISTMSPWKDGHLATIFHAYRRAPRFDDCYPRLRELFKLRNNMLTTLCVNQLRFWLAEYGIDTPLRLVGPKPEKKQDLVLAICKDANADTYLSGPLGRDYLDDEAFKKAGIEVKYHDYQMQPYPQLHGDFIPNLSVLDAWMMQKELP